MTPKILSTTLLSIFVLALATWFFARELTQPSIQPPPQTTWVEESGNTMGTAYRIRFTDPFDRKSKQKLVELVKSQRSLLTEIENLTSTWKSDSQLSAFNRQATIDWFPVDLRTVEIIEQAAEISAIDKRFDITVAPLSDLWGFRPAKRRTSSPTADEIDACLKRIGSDKLQFRREPPALRKTDPLLRVDLSALAAGYLADQLAHQLVSLGVNDFYIDIAGEIIARGRNPQGKTWRVGIAEPIIGSEKVYTQLDLKDVAIATSGNYRNYIELDEMRLGHVLDPTTGRPVKSDVLSATVIDTSCARADAIATLLMTMSAKEGMALANQHGWKVLLLVSLEDGSIGEVRSW